MTLCTGRSHHGCHAPSHHAAEGRQAVDCELLLARCSQARIAHRVATFKL